MYGEGNRTFQTDVEAKDTEDFFCTIEMSVFSTYSSNLTAENGWNAIIEIINYISFMFVLYKLPQSEWLKMTQI